MSVLILHRGSLTLSPYQNWLHDYPGDLILLASQEKLDSQQESLDDFQRYFRHAEAFRRYDMNGAIELRAIELHAQYRFAHIIAMAEFDIERAARLRERLQLAGQTCASAFIYRDKVAMKEACHSGGIPVAHYAPVDTPLDLLNFVAAGGYPVIVKPRNGAASVDATVLRCDQDSEAFLAQGLVRDLSYRPNLIVEEFITGDMYHIDGLVIDQTLVLAWPSAYTVDGLGYTRGEALGSILLAPANPLRTRLQDLVRQTITVLPTPTCMTFHAEVFHTPDDRLLLCEIASRTGGARINDVMTHAFSVNLNEAWVRALCGLPIDLPPAMQHSNPHPDRLAGWILVPPRACIIEQVPEQCRFDWVLDYRVLVRPGQRITDPKSAVDNIASFVVSGVSEADVRQKIAAAQEWFYPQFKFSPLAA
jgi:biotin carboxylase